MAKIKNEKSKRNQDKKLEGESMLTKKTYEDFNEEKPEATDFSPKIKDLKAGKKNGIKTYFCPEHPKVLMEIPGTCPKCGLKLLKEKQL